MIDTRVECYWNLHKDCLSARPTVKGGRVTHMHRVWLKDVSLAVQPAGMARVRNEGRKNVHAFVRGTVINWSAFLPGALESDTDKLERLGWVRATYNPYRHDSFVIADTGERVTTAREAFIAEKRIWILR